MSCRNLLLYTISRKEFNWDHPAWGIILFLEAIGPEPAIRYFPTNCLSEVESPQAATATALSCLPHVDG